MAAVDAGTHPADPTAEFFAQVPYRARTALTHRHNGTILIELLENGRREPWHISVEHGQASVSREHRAADCTLTLERSLFDRIVDGEAQFGPYLFRGRVLLKGDFQAFAILRRLLPDMKGARDPRSLAPGRRG
ncbi:SCP2 sterol-binding domain-containing protein [Plantactinospora sp. B6F1]|uniref:SCP2 sterol-binding domain-containing protein n=1 Tax=Plantactinospora sp. B6F1 TaxID=3158971 RepID=UPI0013EF4544